jgi:glucose-1-phosphate cytidylyltransferase
MKVVILAGGYGTRLHEETQLIPKPMVQIGGHPILWHIMNIYGFYGFNEFVLSLGYKAEVVKNYFLNYHYLENDITVDLSSGDIQCQRRKNEDWIVHLVNTGVHAETGGRLRGLSHLINDTFMMTYGDGVANLDINNLLKFHRSHKKLVTVTAVHPPARFGGLVAQDGAVTHFAEKLQVGEGWINGGFFVLEPEVMHYIQDDFTPWEADPMDQLVTAGQVMAYKHEGFWQCIDTPREVRLMENLWGEGTAPWKVWD